MPRRPRTQTAEESHTAAPETEEGAAVPKSRRRKRGSTGGLGLKLDAPQRAGYVRRWVNNDPRRIAAMQELGYDFVTDKPGEGAARSDDLGSRITRLAGKDENGAPVHSILMETPQEEYDVGIAEREDKLKPFEEAIRRGRDTTGRLQDAYTPSERSSLQRA